MAEQNYLDLVGGCLFKKDDGLLWKYSSVCQSADIDQEYPMHFRLWTSPVKNQNTKQTCVSYALSTMKEIQDYYDTMTKVNYSTSYIYLLRQNAQTTGDGMYIDIALDNMRVRGNVPYEMMPDNLDIDEGKAIAKKAYTDEKLLTEGRKHCIANYAKVETINEIKYSLFVKHSPVPIGIKVFDSFMKVTASGIVNMPNEETEKYRGGHCMLIVGWTRIGHKNYWVVQNSWGTDWGDNGYCYMPMNYSAIVEMYAVFDVEDYPVNLTDINGRWSEDVITKCVRAGIINGFPDGTFKPTNPLTREQLCAVAYNILKKI